MSYHLAALVIAAMFSAGYVILAVIAWPRQGRGSRDDERDDS